MTVVPFRDGFEDPKAFLLHIANDEEITGFCIVVQRKNGSIIPAHINFDNAEMALASGIIMQIVLDHAQ